MVCNSDQNLFISCPRQMCCNSIVAIRKIHHPMPYHTNTLSGGHVSLTLVTLVIEVDSCSLEALLFCLILPGVGRQSICVLTVKQQTRPLTLLLAHPSSSGNMPHTPRLAPYLPCNHQKDLHLFQSAKTAVVVILVYCSYDKRHKQVVQSGFSRLAIFPPACVCM